MFGPSLEAAPSRRQMDLENICPIVDTVTDLRIHDKRGVLRELAREREELGSTGVGNGVAIPHVRLEQVKKPFGIMARLRHPIDFNAVDGQAVDLVCLVLLSKENDGAQLNALAGVARRLRIPDVLDDLRRAPNRVVLYNVMIGRTGRYQSE